MPDFTLCQWSAWVPGLNISDERLIEPDTTSVPETVPKLLRRRLSPLAKAVFNIAEACLGANKAIPVVFSSAHGEIGKSLELLKTIQAGEEVSPTSFSLSVHNAVAGLFSIAYQNNQEISVIAPGQEGIAPAFVEALGLLQEGAGEVLVVLYDEPIPSFYPSTPFNLTAPYPCVLGLRVSLNNKGMSLNLSRSMQTRDDGEHPVQLLALIRFLMTEDMALSLGNQGHCWTWRKN